MIEYRNFRRRARSLFHEMRRVLVLPLQIMMLHTVCIERNICAVSPQIDVFDVVGIVRKIHITCNRCRQIPRPCAIDICKVVLSCTEGQACWRIIPYTIGHCGPIEIVVLDCQVCTRFYRRECVSSFISAIIFSTHGCCICRLHENVDTKNCLCQERRKTTPLLLSPLYPV